MVEIDADDLEHKPIYEKDDAFDRGANIAEVDAVNAAIDRNDRPNAAVQVALIPVHDSVRIVEGRLPDAALGEGY
jgi:hypothetical protein